MQAKAAKKNKSQNKIELPKGCVLHLKNLEKVDREGVKEKFAELETEVSFADFKAGDKEGYIRLQAENAAVEFLKKIESNKVSILVTLIFVLIILLIFRSHIISVL